MYEQREMEEYGPQVICGSQNSYPECDKILTINNDMSTNKLQFPSEFQRNVCYDLVISCFARFLKNQNYLGT